VLEQELGDVEQRLGGQLVRDVRAAFVLDERPHAFIVLEAPATAILEAYRAASVLDLEHKMDTLREHH
jgi:hypothetical protein